MNNDYVVKIYCGKYFNPALNEMMQGKKMDKDFHINGDISLIDVQNIASTIALTTYYEKVERLYKENASFVMSDAVANSFIFLNRELIAGSTALLEGKELM